MDASQRLIGGMLGLVGLWALVYWLWPAPSRAQREVRFASMPAEVMPPVVARESRPVEPAGDASKQSPGEPVAPHEQASLAQPTTMVRPPAFSEYRVQTGDTLGKIAQRTLGSARHADAIAQANQLMSPAHLRAGRVIRIPLDPTNVQGVLVHVDANGTVIEQQAGKPTAPTQPTPEYIVRPGDTLAAIARRVYGSEKHAGYLFEQNKGTVESPQRIRPGQVLVVPPLAVASGGQ